MRGCWVCVQQSLLPPCSCSFRADPGCRWTMAHPSRGCWQRVGSPGNVNSLMVGSTHGHLAPTAPRTCSHNNLRTQQQHERRARTARSKLWWAPESSEAKHDVLSPSISLDRVMCRPGCWAALAVTAFGLSNQEWGVATKRCGHPVRVPLGSLMHPPTTERPLGIEKPHCDAFPSCRREPGSKNTDLPLNCSRLDGWRSLTCRDTPVLLACPQRLSRRSWASTPDTPLRTQQKRSSQSQHCCCHLPGQLGCGR